MKKKATNSNKFGPSPINTNLSSKTSNASNSKKQHKLWMNSSRYLDPPLSPIMVLMDSNDRRSSVHSVTPIIMTPINETHDDNDHLSVNNKLNKLNKSNKIPSYTSQFQLKLNMNTSKLNKPKSKHHKGTPHPQHNTKLMPSINYNTIASASSFYHNQKRTNNKTSQKRKRFSTSNIQKQHNYKLNKVIPRTPVPQLHHSSEESDSDSSFDDQFPYDIPSIPASKSNPVRSKELNKGYAQDMPTNIRSRHTFVTAESSLLDHEDEYDPPRPSLRMIVSNEFNETRTINDKHSDHEAPEMQNKIVCEVVEEDNDDESGCDVNDMFAFRCINDMMYHSEDEIMGDLNLKLMRNRSRNLSVCDPNEQSTTVHHNMFGSLENEDDDDTLSTMSTISTMFTDYKPRKNSRTAYTNKKRLRESKQLPLKRLALHNKWSEASTCDSSGSLIAIKPVINNIRNVKIIRRPAYDDASHTKHVQTRKKKKKKRHRKKNHAQTRKFEPSMKILSEITTLSGHAAGRKSSSSIGAHEFLLASPDPHVRHHACDISASDSVDIAYAEYIGTEYGIGEHLSTYSESTNLSSYYEDSDVDDDDYYACEPDVDPMVSMDGNPCFGGQQSDWQKALQAAYLSGFNKGYSLGVQYQISVNN